MKLPECVVFISFTLFDVCREATDVKVQEPEWNDQAFRTEGELGKTFDLIGPGATRTFSYIITPILQLTRIDQAHTQVSYNDNGQTLNTVGPISYIRIYSSEEVIKFKAIDLGSTLTLGMLTTETQWIQAFIMFAGSLVVFALVKFMGWLKDARVTNNRKKALRELGAEGLKDE